MGSWAAVARSGNLFSLYGAVVSVASEQLTSGSTRTCAAAQHPPVNKSVKHTSR